MSRISGYSLVELVIVILIVSILSAVAIPLLRGRINLAKWVEGKAIAGSIATAIRSWNAATNKVGSWTKDSGLPPTTLGFRSGDLDGAHFKKENFDWQVAYDGVNLTYFITITPPAGVGAPWQLTLDNTGTWSE